MIAFLQIRTKPIMNKMKQNIRYIIKIFVCNVVVCINNPFIFYLKSYEENRSYFNPKLLFSLVLPLL
jgi:hypothetical protein